MQDGDVLKAWRLLDDFACGTWLAAETLPDHRMIYLNYEGPISRDRGTVSRLAAGTFEPISTQSTAKQSFALFDCELATQADFCGDAGQSPAWRFS